MDAMNEIMRALWIGGLAATPLALGVGVVCRAKAWSAATRHLLWLAVLVSFVTPALGWFVWRPNWFGTEQLLGAAEHVIAQLPVKAEAVSTSPEREGRASGNRAMPTTTFVGPVFLPSFTPENAARFAIGESRTLRATPMSAIPMASLPRHPAASGYATNLSNIGAVNGGAVNSAAPLGLAPAGSMRMEQPARARLAATSPRVSERKDATKALQATTPIDSASSRPAIALTASTTTPTLTAARETAAAELLRKSVATLISIRDSLASASPIPMTLWLGVAALLIVVRLTRTIRASRLIRASEPASLRTCAMVAVAAEQIGLSRVPEVRVVNDAVSPMIWCGFTPKLILPRGLWNALDESSQRAVLVHELAHVRRWDHVLCWIDLVIGSLYWWHPLSWWARRRLHDEAEASCDAWVVNTLPESRRAYATALLATKSFVSMKGRVNGPWLAAGGVGVMSGSAKKMARRITMIMTERVMTQKSASKLSVVGAGAAACVIALGAFVMPGLACPPEEHARKHSADHAEKTAAELARASGGVIVVTPDNKAKVKVKKDHAPGAHGGQAGMQFFGEAPALEAMKTRKGGQGFAPMAPMSPMPPMPATAPTPAVPRVAPVGPSGAMFQAWPKSFAVAKSGQCGASRSKVVMSSDDWKTGRVARVYVLPEGKSEAFYELMSRSDVPILVQQKGNNSIVVYATEGQHPTIAGFIKIISPGTSSDPIRGSSGSGQSAGRKQSAANARADSIRAFQEQARGYQQALRELNTSRANIERNASRARGEAERVRAQQEQLEAAAEQMAEQAEQMEEGKARQKLEQAAEKLRQRAEAAEGKSRGTDEQVENIEQQIEELENQAEELEQRAEELQDRISEISEMDEDDRIAELDSEVSRLDSLMVEINEGDEIGEPVDVMPPTEMDDSDAPDMDDEEEADEPEGTPVPAPFAPIPPSNSAFSPAPIPSATPIAPVATPAAGSAATSASPIGTPVPAAAPTPSASPASESAPTPAAPRAQPTPAAASVIAATRKA
jgi:beta-lactamase regulating signal transducer with metallopeptidase domain